MTRLERVCRRVEQIVASRWFFAGVIGLFILQGAWNALSYRWPDLFDGPYHLGIIDLYAHQWSPFIAHQSPSMDQFGDVAHYPSFLYHYLMSFPWRLITALTSDDMVQIIFMRMLNVLMVATGLYVFRSVLIRLGLHRGLTHMVLLLLTLLPIMPFVAAQINYDNMLFPLVAVSVLACQEIIRRKNISYLLLALLAAVSMMAAMVKYTFLPIFLAEVAFTGAVLLRRHGGRQLIRAVQHSFWATPKKRRFVVLAVVVGVSAVFIGRFGYNVLHFGSPSPECDQVLSVKRCAAYAPWARNYQFAQTNPVVTKDPTIYTANWTYIMRSDLFRVASVIPGQPGPTYSPVFRFVKLGATIALFIGGIFIIYYWRVIRRDQMGWFFACIGGVYAGVLWLQNYVDFQHTGQYVGVQGRYLLPVLPLFAGLLALGFTHYLAKPRRARASVALGVVLLVLFLQGGGAMAGVLAGNDDWWWTDSPLTSTNRFIKQTLDPITRI